MVNNPEGGNHSDIPVGEEIFAEETVEPTDLPDVQTQQKDFPTRSATEADIDAMALVLEQANAHAAGESIPETITNTVKHQEIVRRMAYSGVRAQLAVDGENLAGFILVQPSSTEETLAPDDDTDYLALLMTAPAYWGRGVGGQLLDRAAESAREAGKRHLVLWTAQSNDRARELYERKGYVLTDATRISPRAGQLVQYRLDLE